MRPLPGMYRFRCFVRGHHWRKIITYENGRKETQRCRRCGGYRTAVLSDHERVKGMT